MGSRNRPVGTYFIEQNIRSSGGWWRKADARPNETSSDDRLNRNTAEFAFGLSGCDITQYADDNKEMYISEICISKVSSSITRPLPGIAIDPPCDTSFISGSSKVSSADVNRPYWREQRWKTEKQTSCNYDSRTEMSLRSRTLLEPLTLITLPNLLSGGRDRIRSRSEPRGNGDE